MVSVDVLYKNLSPSERDVVLAVHKELSGETINVYKSDTSISKSIFIGALRLCEVAGILTKHGKGMKGTDIKVLDQEAFNRLVEMITE